jgi:hypothetical protein
VSAGKRDADGFSNHRLAAIHSRQKVQAIERRARAPVELGETAVTCGPFCAAFVAVLNLIHANAPPIQFWNDN